MDSEFSKKRALFLWQEGQRLHDEGDLSRAIALYTQSIAIYPTAESYTFRGWAYSFQGRIDDAITECKKAIAIDPSFGNPYNDIGSYLIVKGKHDEAEEWLKRAKVAVRYDFRHSPCINLGRIYAAKGLLIQAVHEFEQALELFPREPNCTAALEHLRKMLN